MPQKNIAQQQAMVAKLTDDQLAKELEQPNPNVVPGYLLLGELQKRQSIRQAAQAGPQPQGTVKDEMLQQMRAAPPQPMQSSVAQQMPQGPPPQGVGIAPLAQQPQGYADGGGVQMPKFSGLYGLPLPEEALQFQQAYVPQYMQMTGLQKPGSLQDYMSQAQGFLPDPSSAYDEPVAELRHEYEEERSQGKAQALMRMGLAMMNAPTGNFLTALGAGGAAGLDALEKTKLNQRALKAQLANAQIMASNAKSQAAAHSLDAAASLRGADTTAYNQSMQLAQQSAGQALQAQQAAAEIKGSLENARINASAQVQAAGIHAGATMGAAKMAAQVDRERIDAQYGEKGVRDYNRALAGFYEKNASKIGTSMGFVKEKGPDGKLHTRQDIYTADDAATDAAAAAAKLFPRPANLPPTALAETAARRPPISAFNR